MSGLIALMHVAFFVPQAIPFPGPGMAHSSGSACGTYSHCRQLTIDHTQVPSTQTNFPAVLIATEADWAVTGSGGDVQNTVTQSGGAPITIPADFILADSTCTTPLAGWEFEKYTTTTGALVIHFLVASLSSSADTTSIWVCAGKSSVTTQQNTVSATWNANYYAVWHLSDGTTLNTIDSTGNGHTGSIGAATATAGEIDGAAATAGGSFVAFPFPTLLFNGGYTIQLWLEQDNSAGFNAAANSASGTDATLYFDSTGAASFAQGLFANVGSATNGVTLGSLHSLVIVDTAVTGVLDTYVDSTHKQNTTQPNNFTAQTINFGNNPAGGGTNWQGKYDDLRISNVALSADWVTSEYNNQKPSSTFIAVGTRH